MGKEVRMSDYGDDDGEDDEHDKVPEWEIGLPEGDDLTPLSQSLVPSILALAFSIIPERSRTIHDVDRASRVTISSLRSSSSGNGYSAATEEVVVVVDRVGSSSHGSDPKKQRRSDGGGGEAAAVDSMAEEEGDSGTEKTLKRPRLVWTPQLHKRFVDVVDHLGIKSAVPKTIMQLMNVEGLSRENVASHLQKYRLYLKRIQGLTTEDGPYSSDQLFSSTPVPPQSFQDGGGSNGATGKLGVPSMIPMPVYGNHVGMMQGQYHQYRDHGNESNQYMMQQQNRFGTMVTSPSVGGGGDVNDK
ncbi:PREDICTED: transcription factor BOA-like [Camelina sativa]|uniref:Transcription factor BOA-like n=1 Tax=Camelina sativa TaxID=90675 RepID=A0ABM0UNF6_CAMSA|nr:PREDICTED: transcription factor BOA-like [Camelina sativa]XP_010443719.1 PREDICTED: transcription factor BOA-like [Camelina sativa]